LEFEKLLLLLLFDAAAHSILDVAEREEDERGDNSRKLNPGNQVVIMLVEARLKVVHQRGAVVVSGELGSSRVGYKASIDVRVRALLIIVRKSGRYQNGT
jgi:hypothetical protein